MVWQKNAVCRRESAKKIEHLRRKRPDGQMRIGCIGSGLSATLPLNTRECHRKYAPVWRRPLFRRKKHRACRAHRQRYNETSPLFCRQKRHQKVKISAKRIRTRETILKHRQAVYGYDRHLSGPPLDCRRVSGYRAAAGLAPAARRRASAHAPDSAKRQSSVKFPEMNGVFSEGLSEVSRKELRIY